MTVPRQLLYNHKCKVGYGSLNKPNLSAAKLEFPLIYMLLLRCLLFRLINVLLSLHILSMSEPLPAGYLQQ